MKDESTEPRSFAARLAAVRTAYGIVTGRPKLARAEFAHELGLQRETYRRYERGEVSPPLEVLSNIRGLTGISLDYLISGLEYGAENPTMLSVECRASYGDRMRWARELCEPDVRVAARAMGVATQTYQRWEDGREWMPDDKQADFAHRFNVSLAYLRQGLPTGIPAPVLVALREAHPDLWRIAGGNCTGMAPDSSQISPKEANGECLGTPATPSNGPRSQG
jgi:transcriptional regulator with XRE-family HTH domain